MSTELKKTPWHNGFWYNKNQKTFLTCIEGEKLEVKNMVCLDYPDAKPMWAGTITYGDFGPADPEIVKATGIKNYNLKNSIASLTMTFYGVLNKEGTQMTAKGFLPNQLDVSNWVNQEELEKLKEDREPINAPSSPYKPQPDNLGKILWFSGTRVIVISKSFNFFDKGHGFTVNTILFNVMKVFLGLTHARSNVKNVFFSKKKMLFR